MNYASVFKMALTAHGFKVELIEYIVENKI